MGGVSNREESMRGKSGKERFVGKKKGEARS